MRTRCCSAPYKCPRATIWTIRSGSISAGHRERSHVDFILLYSDWNCSLSQRIRRTTSQPKTDTTNSKLNTYIKSTHTHTHTQYTRIHIQHSHTHVHSTQTHTRHALDVRLLIKIDEWSKRFLQDLSCCWHTHLQIFMENTLVHIHIHTYIYLYIKTLNML